MDEKLYFCDPAKNKNCKKTACAYLHKYGPCRLTTKEEFKLNDDYELIERIRSGKGLMPLK